MFLLTSSMREAHVTVNAFRSFLTETQFPLPLCSDFIVRYPELDFDSLVLICCSKKKSFISIVNDAIRELHTSSIFDAHASALRAKTINVQVPRLRSLLTEGPSLQQTLEELVVLIDGLIVDDKPDQISKVLHAIVNSSIYFESDSNSLLDNFISYALKMNLIFYTRFMDLVSELDISANTRLKVNVHYAKHLATNRDFDRVVDICRNIYSSTAAGSLDTDIWELYWYALLRTGNVKGAIEVLDEWSAYQWKLKRPLVYRSVALAHTDLRYAIELLHITGASSGNSSIAGNLLYSKFCLEADRFADAEVCIRGALNNGAKEHKRAMSEYMLALHNILLRTGRKSKLLHQSMTLLNPDAHLIHDNNFDTINFMLPDRLDQAQQPEIIHSDLPEPISDARVAIVMTAYNAEKFIEAAINSIICQTYTNFMLYIVEDCSTDSTRTVLDRYVDNKKIVIMHNESNIGTYASKNIGIQRAINDGASYVGLCDSDDIYTPNHIQVHLQSMVSNLDVVCSTSNWLRLSDSLNVDANIWGGFVETCPFSTFFDAKIFASVGYYDSVRFGADREYLARLRFHFGQAQFVHINKLLTVGRRHPNSLTRLRTY